MTTRRAIGRTPRTWRTRLVAGLFLVAAGAAGPGRADDPPPVQVPLIETSRSELVLIEVYARDSRGRPVRDLKLSDFTLKIDHNQKPSPINSLEWIEAESLAPPAGVVADGAAPGAPAATPAAGSPAGAADATATRDRPRRFLLFFEDATSSPTQMTAARRAAIGFLEGPGLPTDQFGIASYSQKRKLEILQEFTSDRALLRRVLEKSAADNSRWSDYGTERLAALEEIRRTEKESYFMGSQGGKAGFAHTGVQSADQMRRTYATEDAAKMGRVVNTMQLLVDLLAPWPGYKAVVFIGEGVPENSANDFGLNDPRLAITSELSGLSFAAGGANVTLHTIQVAGLVAGDSEQVGSASRRSNALANLALDTGGINIASNDLGGAFAAVEESSAGYYLLTYAPLDTPDGEYHSVALKCARRGVTLRYRRGFVRYTPEEARTRALQAAYVAPEMHRGMGLDLALVAGPRTADGERVFDLVLYVPPRRLLFLPQPGGIAARLEVGVVAIAEEGGESLRLARRLRVVPEEVRVMDAATSGLDLYARVRLPDRAHTITAVVSDLNSGALGSVRVATAKPSGEAPGAQGLSLYAAHEKTLWIEIADRAGKSAADQEVAAGSTSGPASRTRFAPGETIAFGFRPAPGATPAAGALRLVVRRDDEVVRTLPVAGPPEGRPADAPLHAELATAGLADGDYIATVESTAGDRTVEIGRTGFRIRPRDAT